MVQTELALLMGYTALHSMCVGELCLQRWQQHIMWIGHWLVGFYYSLMLVLQECLRSIKTADNEKMAALLAILQRASMDVRLRALLSAAGASSIACGCALPHVMQQTDNTQLWWSRAKMLAVHCMLPCSWLHSC